MHVLWSMRALAATAIVVTLGVLAGGAQAWDASIYRGPCGEVALPTRPTGLDSAVRVGTRCGTFAIEPHGVRFIGLRKPSGVLNARQVISIVGEQPIGRTRAGLTFTSVQGAVTFRSRPGRVAKRLGLDRFWFDSRSETILFVSPAGGLMRTDGRRTQRLAGLSQLRLGRGFQIEPLPSGRIALVADHLVVLGANGELIARDYRGGQMPTESRNGAIATISARASDTYARLREAVRLLRMGDRSSTLLYAHEFAPLGCGRAPALSWRGHDLLYSTTEGHVVVIDTASGDHVDLSRVVARLPGDFQFAGWA
jgi:hypothetical protein